MGVIGVPCDSRGFVRISLSCLKILRTMCASPKRHSPSMTRGLRNSSLGCETKDWTMRVPKVREEFFDQAESDVFLGTLELLLDKVRFGRSTLQEHEPLPIFSYRRSSC